MMGQSDAFLIIEKARISCKTCRFWGVDFEGVCDYTGPSFTVTAYADDDQGLEARLHTKADFFCKGYEKLRGLK